MVNFINEFYFSIQTIDVETIQLKKITCEKIA
jgi:hypothetical protein